MWQEEIFALRLVPDSDHYLIWLGLGLLVWSALRPSSENRADQISTLLALFVALAIGFMVGALNGVGSFVFTAAILFAVSSALFSVPEAVGLILILYVCRPWEVLPASEWWAQVPRQCIWLWLLAWLGSTTRNPKGVYGCIEISRGVALTLIFAVWCLATAFLSKDAGTSLQYYVDTLFRALTLVVILSVSTQTLADVQRLHQAFVVGVGTLALFSLWRFEGLDQAAPLELLQGNQEHSHDRRLEAVGSLGNSNDIAAVILIPLGFLLPLLTGKRTSIGSRIAIGVVVFF